MSNDDLTRQGIAALKSGDKGRAKSLLLQAVEANPEHQVALLWLTAAVDDSHEKRQYLERVLAINPNNDAGQRAAHGIAQLNTEAATQPPPATTGATMQLNEAPQEPAAEPIPNPLGQQPQEPAFSFSSSSATPASEPSEQSSPFGLPSSSSPSAQSQSTPDWLNNTAASDTSAGSSSAGGAFSMPSSDSSSGGTFGQQSGFSVPSVDDLPPVEKKASDKTWVWILVGLLVMLPCICVVGGIGMLTVLGGQVSEEFTEIESGLGEFEDDGFTGSDNSALGLDSNFQGRIEVGERVDGELNTIFEADDWTFQGSAGQTVTISCNAAVGSTTDPRINLLDPDGSFLAADDDGGTNYNAVLRNITLPTDGEYTIKVDVFETGRYVLRLE
jgi:hypothetical protein